MAVSRKLVQFVVNLVVDDTQRERFYSSDLTGRDQMMSDAGLTEEERQAINQGNADALHKLLNTEVSVPMVKKGKARKARVSKMGAKSAAKSAKKKATTKSAKKKASKKR